MSKSPGDIGMKILMLVVIAFGIGAASSVLFKPVETPSTVEAPHMAPEELAKLMQEADEKFEGHAPISFVEEDLQEEAAPAKRTAVPVAKQPSSVKAVPVAVAKPTKQVEATPAKTAPAKPAPSKTAPAKVERTKVDTAAADDLEVVAKPARAVPASAKEKAPQKVTSTGKNLGQDWTEIAAKPAAQPKVAADDLSSSKQVTTSAKPNTNTSDLRIPASTIEKARAQVAAVNVTPIPAGDTTPTALPAIKAIEAPALVAEPFKQTIVMSSPTGDRAWLKMDAQSTVIVNKGEVVPGLGTFHGMDGKVAKFDNGVVPQSSK